MAELDLRLPISLERWDDGSIRVTGHRVMLFDIIDSMLEEDDFSELGSRFPSISLSQLHEIVRFCYEHDEAIKRFHAELRESAEILRKSIEHKGPGRDELMRRMDERRGHRRPR